MRFVFAVYVYRYVGRFPCDMDYFSSMRYSCGYTFTKNAQCIDRKNSDPFIHVLYSRLDLN